MFKAKTLLMSLVLISCTLSPVLVRSADSWIDRAGEGGLDTIGKDAYGEDDSPKSVQGIIATIIKVILGLSAIIFVTLLILAGFKYMTSGGDQEKVKEAIKQITHSVVGLLIVVAAYSITYFITIKAIPEIMK